MKLGHIIKVASYISEIKFVIVSSLQTEFKNQRILQYKQYFSICWICILLV